MTLEKLEDILLQIKMEFRDCERPVIIIKTSNIDVSKFNEMIIAATKNVNLLEYSGGTDRGSAQKYLSLVFTNGKIQIEENGN